MYNPFSLKDKTILVTGASSGIGQATSIECSRLGAKVIITGRNKNRLDETFSKLVPDIEHQQIIADLEKQESVDELVDSLPFLNGVVHCAGILKRAPFPFLKPEDVKNVCNVNFFAPYYLSYSLIKKKKIGTNSSVIFIASVAGIKAVYIGGAAYAASKGAIFSLAKNMAFDLKSKKIRVNTILPGMIETPFTDMDTSVTKEQYESDALRYIYKRYGKPEDVAYMVVYLLSDAAQWITGSDFTIDGGITLG
jgi:NAD(P)-dependent dehydrogenase (short-subunit alcohol dehydrogenase family)